MKNFKKSKTKTSKTKTSKAKTTKAKTSKTKTHKYFLRKALFSLFPNSFPFRNDCVQNPENRTEQVLSSFCHCAIYIFPYSSKTHSFILKCGLFTNVQFICQCRMSSIGDGGTRTFSNFMALLAL